MAASSGKDMLPPPVRLTSDAPKLAKPEALHTQSREFQNCLELIKSRDLDNAKVFEPDFDKGFRYHPESFLNTQHKKDMFYAFDARDAHGLAEYLYEYAAKKYNRGDRMFKYFEDDKSLPRRVLPFLITTMHPEVVKALICGDMSYRCCTERAFKGIVDRTTGPRLTPGIYFNQLYDRGTDMEGATQRSSPVGNVPTNEGKGFSFNEWKIIRDHFELYSKTDNAASTKLAKVFDHVHVASHKADIINHNKEPDKRRFFKDSRTNHLKAFLDAIDNRILKSSSRLDTLLKAAQAHWNVFEIGYGNKTLQRLKDHIGNEDTNWTWGLLVGIVEVEFKGRYAIRQGQLLYLCDRDHRDLGEALCSVLASSYHDEMGCNPKRAGAIGSVPYSMEFGIRQNIIKLFSRQGGRVRVFDTSLEFNQSKLDVINRLNAQEKEKPLADAKADLEEHCATSMKRYNKIKRELNIIQNLTYGSELVDLLERYKAAHFDDKS